MPCYFLYFGTSMHKAVHHRFSLKTCIKLKQQKLYCHLIWYCHFPTVYLPRIAVLISQHHLCLHIWEVPKIFTKWGAGSFVEMLPPVACAVLPACTACCTPSVGNEAPWLSKTKIFFSCKVSHSLEVYPVQITIMKVSFPLLPEMD